ncbi:MAG: hypothetical protein AVDCRST_MAG96-4295 [uncultured Segetibacter sp.]|uniref:Uncharacterized protein n=1 Tax=uncultured Segetibacter sp. TaxID=481133 RepID=A0A6J4U7B5_9BACT|nr:MAG: hypothetical protein AVDCRST_MAG96-4295 [uncultured Segetibacter sp.]
MHFRLYRPKAKQRCKPNISAVNEGSIDITYLTTEIIVS